MPKLKQPNPLQKLALSALLEFAVNYCDQLSVQGSEDDLRHGISTIKQQICIYIPRHSLAGFTSGFLDEFYSKQRPTPQYEVASEILMDMDIPGLRCKGPVVAYLDPGNVQRFRGLEELDLSFLPATQPMRLDNFHLNRLTTFIYPDNCTDFHLRVIGQNCPMFQVLNVQSSKVTDEGLRSLSQCLELRVVDIQGCIVSPIGISDFLSVNTKIEEFSHCDDNGYNFSSYSDSLVCPCMRRFTYDTGDRNIGPETLPAIVTRFPGLTHLGILGRIPRNLSTLKFLNKLTGLEIWFGHGMLIEEVEEAWGSLKALLKFIGANITTLNITCSVVVDFLRQDDLDVIFNFCPNIEHLEFEKGQDLIVIPPFQKLRKLAPCVSKDLHGIQILEDAKLKFCKLPNLETLSVIGYEMNFQTMESIILDDVKFPSLSLIETNRSKADLLQIQHIAETNNLDVEIRPDLEWINFMENWRHFELDDGEDIDEIMERLS